MKPKIKITGYTGDMDMKEIEECIKKQNQIITSEDEFKITYIKKSKNKNSTIFAECTPRLFHRIMNVKKLFLDWERLPVYEDIKVPRCYKCQDYYHKNTNCQNKTVCEFCAEEHNVSECPRQNKKCKNCMIANTKYNQKHELNHEASDPNCPSYKYLLNILKTKLDYGQQNG